MPNYIIAYKGGKQPDSPEEGAKHRAKCKAWVARSWRCCGESRQGLWAVQNGEYYRTAGDDLRVYRQRVELTQVELAGHTGL